MTMTKTIPADRLLGLDLHQGDTLHIVSLVDSAFLVEISRTDDQSTPPHGKVGEWLRSARGSVKLSANETVDDARMSYYDGKYDLNA